MKLRSLSLHIPVALAGLALAAVSSAQFQISELGVNPQNNDDGYEYFEIRGAAGASLAGLTLLTIDGDGGSTGAGSGIIDGVYDLGAFRTGTSGTFYGRNAAGPAAQAGVSENVYSTLLGAGGFENGSVSFLLVSGFTGALGNDLDTNSDGVLDTSPWASVVDSISWADADVDDDLYGAIQFRNGATNGKLNPASAFTPDAFSRLAGDGFVIGDTTSANATDVGITPFDVAGAGRVAVYSKYRGAHADGTSRDFDFQDLANSGLANSGENPRFNTLTPGGMNPVPEPATMAAMALGLGAFAARRRKAPK